MKKILAAIILVALVLSVFTALSASYVKAQDQTTGAKILSYSSYIAPSNSVLASQGDLIVVGEVQNTGTAIDGIIYINAVAYNSTGAAIAQTETPVIGVPQLLPSQKAPFYVDFNPQTNLEYEQTGVYDQSWVSSITNITLQVPIVLNSTQTPYTDLQLSSLTGFDNSGAYTVSGSVLNNGTQTVGDVWVLTTYYNSTGTVIGMNCTNYLTDSFSPGQSVAFTAIPTDNTAQLSNSVTNFSVIVESSPLSSSTTPAPENSPTPTPPSTTSSPKSTNSSSSLLANSTLMYGIIAAVVIIVAVLAALLLFRNRRKSSSELDLPPPPPPPPPP